MFFTCNSSSADIDLLVFSHTTLNFSMFFCVVLTLIIGKFDGIFTSLSIDKCTHLWYYSGG